MFTQVLRLTNWGGLQYVRVKWRQRQREREREREREKERHADKQRECDGM